MAFVVNIDCAFYELETGCFYVFQVPIRRLEIKKTSCGSAKQISVRVIEPSKC